MLRRMPRRRWGGKHADDAESRRANDSARNGELERERCAATDGGGAVERDERPRWLDERREAGAVLRRGRGSEVVHHGPQSRERLFGRATGADFDRHEGGRYNTGRSEERRVGKECRSR